MTSASFVIIVHDPARDGGDCHAGLLERISTDLRLATAFAADGLTVMGDHLEAFVALPDQAGLVCGRIFDRMTSWRVATPEGFKQPIDTVETVASRYWGGYLLIRRVDGGVEIFRDPSGTIPCYRLRADGATLLTNRPSRLIDAGIVKTEVDWTLLTQSLVFRNLRPARTCLRGIDELMPGTCLRIGHSGTKVRTIWSPWDHSMPSSDIPSDSEAVERVERVITNCVGAWGRCFERPLLELSGGLDSSIIAAVLARSGSTPVCATFAPVAGDPDETPYARAVAEHFGLRLEILPIGIEDVDLTRSMARDLPRPSARAFSQAHDARLRTLAGQEGVDAFFSGGGGDNVFALLRSVLPVIDRWKLGGGGALSTVSDIAHVADVSFLKVLVASLQRAFRMRKSRLWPVDRSYLSTTALRDLPLPQGHPWLDIPTKIYPGKRVHARSLMVIQNHLEGFGRLQQAPIVSPLLSQPVVETCLAVPTWLWCAGGIDRSLARRGFTRRLPELTVQRRSKGSFDSYAAAIYETNRGLIREMLLDGELARHALLDGDQIEAALASARIEHTALIRLLDLIDAESWAMAWATRHC